MFQEGFLFALVGLFGTFVGVVASLIPSELVAKRDHYERVVKIWKMLDLENVQIFTAARAAASVVEQSKDGLSHKGSINPLIIPRLPTVAWQAAITNSDWIDEATTEVLDNLSLHYSEVNRANTIIDQYSATINEQFLALISSREESGLHSVASFLDAMKGRLNGITKDEKVVSKPSGRKFW